MHAHSLLWLGAVVAVTAVYYRRMLGPTWTAGVAALLFAVDDARGPTVGFLANRNVLVAATFGVSALIAHDRWRRDGSRPAVVAGAAAAPGRPVLEGGGHRGVRLPGRLRALRRPRGLAARVPVPSGLMPRRSSPGAVLRASWGYGVRDVGLYIDPLTDTGRFLAAAAGRIPILLLGQWSPIPADLAAVLRAAGLRRPVVGRGGVPRAARLRDGPAPPPRSPRPLLARRHALRLDPRLRHAPMDRLLTFAGIGAFGLLAQYWAFVFGAPCDAPSSAIWRVPAVALAWFFVAVHAVVGPDRPSVPGRRIRWGPGGSSSVSTSATPLGPSVEDRTVVIVNAPSPVNASYLILRRELSGQPVPRHTRVLRAGDTLRDDPPPRRADARDQTPRRLPPMGPRPGLPERAPTDSHSGSR